MIRLMDVKTDNVTDYKDISLLLAFPFCMGKCEGCQSKHLLGKNNTQISEDVNTIVLLYNKLVTHKAIVMAGLEPFDSFDNVCEIIEAIVKGDKPANLVIYTGYTEEEYKSKFEDKLLNSFLNNNKNGSKLIVKIGRYDAVEHGKSWFSNELGVTLATNNQCVYTYTDTNKPTIERAPNN